MDSDALIIRPLCADDRDASQAFFDQMGEESASFFNVGHGNERRVMGFFTGDTRDHLFWGAFDGGGLAGIIFIWNVASAVPWMGIAVSEKWKGHHLGRRLIDGLKEYCLGRGCGGILLTTGQTNYRAQKLYEHEGFERIGVSPKGEFLYILRFAAGQTGEA